MIMKFYHFTARDRLPSIMSNGLTIGDVPACSLFEDNEIAVWLTSNPRPSGQGLGFVREFTDHDRFSGLTMEEVLALRGPAPDKTEARITIAALPEPQRLQRWSDWARDYVEPEIYDELVRRGGAKHLDWYLYWGVIPPEYFEEIELRCMGSRYSPGKVIHAEHRWPRRSRAA